MMVKRSYFKKGKRTLCTSHGIFVSVLFIGALVLLSSLSSQLVQGFESDSGSLQYAEIADFDTGGGGINPIPSPGEVTAEFNHTPEIGVVGESMIFNASNSSVSDSQSQFIESYLWDFGDGTTDEGMIVEHSFEQFGCFNVTLNVVDNNEINDTTNDTIVVIPKQVSNITIHDPQTGDMLILRWNVSDTSNINHYKINRSDLGEPIIWQTSPYTDTDVTVGETYIYTITAIGIIDEVEYESQTSEAMQAIPLPPNVQPIAHAGGPYNGKVNEPIPFDGSQSTDADGEITLYTWEFGDGTTATGPNPIHAYATAGSYTITLTVTDDQETTSTFTTVAVINTPTIPNKKPQACIHGSFEGYCVNELITFSAAGSNDPDGSINHYLWDFGDNTIQEGYTTSHQYKKIGTYYVTLSVTDNKGVTDSENILIHISKTNSPPSIPQIKMSFDQDTDVYRINVASNDSDNDSVQYLIDWGDNTITNSSYLPPCLELQTLHTWNEPGLYTIKISARDSKNATSETREIIVLKSDTSDESSPPIESVTLTEDNQAENTLDLGAVDTSQVMYLGLVIIFSEIALISVIFIKFKTKQNH